jgi:YidC/Oxa1 family membrane protein insertase
MKQMQALQPKIETLRAAHKDNPQKVNKETMEMYKKYKINPLGGCLPMLLQMPVFFALYQVLMKSIELRGAQFFWIKDLSQPDRLIANIPMFLQQKQSTAPKTSSAGASDQMAQQQRMMMFMMPVLFGVLFYKLPSGLVLYWLTNTILTIVEQGMFLKPHLFHVEQMES